MRYDTYGRAGLGMPYTDWEASRRTRRTGPETAASAEGVRRTDLRVDQTSTEKRRVARATRPGSRLQREVSQETAETGVR